MKPESTTRLYARDVVILKSYGGKLKLTLHNTLRKSGFETDSKKYMPTEKGTVNDEKLVNNIVRTRARIYELAMCNRWELFITLTIDPTKYDRKDLKKYIKDLSQWIRNYNKKHGLKMKYLLVPEKHKDGSWHMHGLLMGLPTEHITKNEHGYFDWVPYKLKFGYCSISDVKNKNAISAYITKYISKSLLSSVSELNAHMYYSSKGLEVAKEIKRGTLAVNDVPWDFQNDYVSLKWLNDLSLEQAKLLID